MKLQPPPTRADTEPGRWKRVPPASGRAGETAPLTWQATPPVAVRALRSLGLPGAVGVAIFVVVLLVTAVIVLQGMRAEASPSDGLDFVATGVNVDGRGAPPAHADAGGAEAGTPESVPLFVHVTGEVREPGVVELIDGARVLDAIDAAGGATPTALLNEMNLARMVSDGERIVVPNAETLESIIELELTEHPAGGAADGSVNINAATAEQLEMLPRIGPALAQRIVEWREQYGPFASVEQLLEVDGIGSKTFEGFRDRVTV